MKRTSPDSPVALVTGAGRRLGRHIALALAGAGFDIVVHHNASAAGARRTVREVEMMEQRAFAVRGNIARKREVARFVRLAREKFGRIDVLVNNAAIFTEGTILDTTEDDFDTTLNINLKGMFLCSQAVAPIMLKQRKGEIVNIVSLGGLQPWSQHLPYSVAKAGAVMLTKCMAKSLAPDIRVNGIAPGTIIMEGEEDPSLRHVAVKGIPLKKYGSPSDITDLVVYLATAARYMTGQILVVDGGRSLLF